MAPQRSIAIASGGTAGHVHPALALADAYREAFPAAEILFIGAPGGMEASLVPARGYRLELVRGAPFMRQGIGGKIRALGALAAGVAGARRLLGERKIRLVIGFGGYASAGALVAARSLGLKTAIHEANVFPGLANRWLGRIVDRIYLAFEQTRSAFPPGRALVTGNPVRREIAALARNPPSISDPAGRRARFLITGGSGGSEFLNLRAPALLEKIAGHGFAPEALHQAGEFPLDAIRAAYNRAAIPATVVSYIDDMAGAYARTDFAVSSAGSQTMSELAVCGLPCLLVPLAGAAADHQGANAAARAEAAGGLWVREEAWEADSLAARIAALLRDHRAGKSARRTRPRELDAAADLIADLEKLMRGRW
jgi:UDP-N-acetylglucosamine--N-acetylmuramyl-(pentapeptide) pyrophosphoryl-undecaprenol N-acetylglucosamine transferase